MAAEPFNHQQRARALVMGVCPYCEGTDLSLADEPRPPGSFGAPDIVKPYLRQDVVLSRPVHCENCGREWAEGLAVVDAQATEYEPDEEGE